MLAYMHMHAGIFLHNPSSCLHTAAALVRKVSSKISVEALHQGTSSKASSMAGNGNTGNVWSLERVKAKYEEYDLSDQFKALYMG